MIIQINNNPQSKIINHAVQVLRRGGILVIPTETAYGLACDATNKKAVEKIYKIKGRSFKKFLPLVCSSINQIKKYFKISKKELGLFKKYNGLSVVLLLKHLNTRPQSRSAGSRSGRAKALKHNICLLPKQNSCAVRVSTNNIAKLLAKKLGKPITATSANVSAGANCYSIGEVLRQFKINRSGDRQSANNNGVATATPDLILDAGKLKKRKSSTIVSVEGEKVRVLRQGEVKIINYKS